MLVTKIQATLKELAKDSKEQEAFLMLGVICSFSFLILLVMFTSPMLELFLQNG